MGQLSGIGEGTESSRAMKLLNNQRILNRDIIDALNASRQGLEKKGRNKKPKI